MGRFWWKWGRHNVKYSYVTSLNYDLVGDNYSRWRNMWTLATKLCAICVCLLPSVNLYKRRPLLTFTRGLRVVHFFALPIIIKNKVYKYFLNFRCPYITSLISNILEKLIWMKYKLIKQSVSQFRLYLI